MKKKASRAQVQINQFKKICIESNPKFFDDWQTIYCKKCGYDKWNYDKKNAIISCNNCDNKTTVKMNTDYSKAFGKWRKFNLGY